MADMLEEMTLCEEVFHTVWQAHDRMSGETRTSLGGRINNRRHFMVGQSWNDRRDHHSHRNPGLRKTADRCQPLDRHRGAGFHDAGKLSIQSCDRDENRCGIDLRQFSQQVAVA